MLPNSSQDNSNNYIKYVILLCLCCPKTCHSRAPHNVCSPVWCHLFNSKDALIHYPQQILAVGPMVQTWNMRHEAKLSFFKRASHLGNFINIASTLAKRHQRWLCYEMSSRELLHTALECGPIQSISVVEGESDSIKSIILGMSGAIY